MGNRKGLLVGILGLWVLAVVGPFEPLLMSRLLRRFGVLGGGGGAQAPLTSPCPPSNHTITINLNLTFAASWFHGCFCHIIALHFGPEHSL